MEVQAGSRCNSDICSALSTAPSRPRKPLPDFYVYYENNQRINHYLRRRKSEAYTQFQVDKDRAFAGVFIRASADERHQRVFGLARPVLRRPLLHTGADL